MKKSSEKSVKRVTIYEVPLLSRVFLMALPMSFSIMVLWGAFNNGDHVLLVIKILALLAFNAAFYFFAFGTYFRLDVKSNQFVSSRFLVKERFNLDNIVSNKLHITKINDHYSSDRIPFTIKIQDKNGGIRLFTDWSYGNLPMLLQNPSLSNDKLQIKRLQKFCDKCNQYLNSRQK